MFAMPAFGAAQHRPRLLEMPTGCLPRRRCWAASAAPARRSSSSASQFSRPETIAVTGSPNCLIRADQVAPQPLRDRSWKRRDDDLVEIAVAHRLLHRDERIRAADTALDGSVRGPCEERQRGLQRPVRRLAIAHVGNQQHELRRPRLRSTGHFIEQPRRGGRPIRHHEDPRRSRRVHDVILSTIPNAQQAQRDSLTLNGPRQPVAPLRRGGATPARLGRGREPLSRPRPPSRRTRRRAARRAPRSGAGSR